MCVLVCFNPASGSPYVLCLLFVFAFIATMVVVGMAGSLRRRRLLGFSQIRSLALVDADLRLHGALISSSSPGGGAVLTALLLPAIIFGEAGTAVLARVLPGFFALFLLLPGPTAMSDLAATQLGRRLRLWGSFG